jgi:hypothetical protein
MFRITCTNVGLETRFIASKIRYRDTKRMVIMRATNLLNHSFRTDINLREKICMPIKMEASRAYITETLFIYNEYSDNKNRHTHSPSLFLSFLFFCCLNVFLILLVRKMRYETLLNN